MIILVLLWGLLTTSVCCLDCTLVFAGFFEKLCALSLVNLSESTILSVVHKYNSGVSGYEKVV